MKLCTCGEHFITNHAKHCRTCYLKELDKHKRRCKCGNIIHSYRAKKCLECYRKSCVSHKPKCKCGKTLVNYNSKMCKKCADKLKNKPIVQYDLKGNYLAIWDSIHQATRVLRIHQSSLGQCLKGQRNTAQGFIWKYETN